MCMRLFFSIGNDEADGVGQDFNVEIVAGQHLTVQAELYLLVGVYINTLGLAVDEMSAYLGVIQMVAQGVYLEHTQESHQSGGLAVAYLNQAVIILGAGRAEKLAAHVVVVAQCAEQHTLAGVQCLTVGTHADAVKTAAENSLYNTPAVGVLVALAAQLVGCGCHNRVKTKVADIDRVVVFINLHDIYLVGGTLDEILNAKEILALIILYEIVTASVGKNGQVLVGSTDHARCHLIDGAVTAACYEAGLHVGVFVTKLLYKLCGCFLCCGLVNPVIQLCVNLLYLSQDLIGIACLAGLIVDDETVVHYVL